MESQHYSHWSALTAPTNANNVGFPLTLMAAASSPFGIAAVDFYSRGLLLGSDASAPYALTLNLVVPGSHTFTAVARDNSSLSTTSAPVTVNVVGNLPVAPQLLGSTLIAGQLNFQIDGPAGYLYFVDASTNLIGWNSVFATNSPALPFAWLDTDTNYFLQRFYRVRLGP